MDGMVNVHNSHCAGYLFITAALIIQQFLWMRHNDEWNEQEFENEETTNVILNYHQPYNNWTKN